MNTVTDKVLPAYEKVIHIAFGCGCVQSYRPKQMTSQRCPIHGDTMVSSNQELVPKAVAA
jgi:hypothetical protein